MMSHFGRVSEKMPQSRVLRVLYMLHRDGNSKMTKGVKCRRWTAWRRPCRRPAKTLHLIRCSCNKVKAPRSQGAEGYRRFVAAHENLADEDQV